MRRFFYSERRRKTGNDFETKEAIILLWKQQIQTESVKGDWGNFSSLGEYQNKKLERLRRMRRLYFLKEEVNKWRAIEANEAICASLRKKNRAIKTNQAICPSERSNKQKQSDWVVRKFCFTEGRNKQKQIEINWGEWGDCASLKELKNG